MRRRRTLTRRAYFYFIHSKFGSYIGSTWNYRKRKLDHNSICYNENGQNYNIPLYQKLRLDSDWDFELIEVCECRNDYERLWHERFWTDLLQPELNKNNAINEDGEYDQRKNFAAYNCECGSKYSINHKGQHFSTKKHKNYVKLH